MTTPNRSLTPDELHLLRWMLEHGSREAAAFLPQLDLAEVTPWRCDCGCASFNLQLRGHLPAPPGVHILADFVFGDESNLSGIFLYHSDGLLSGVEVYGLVGDASGTLPRPEDLRPLSDPALG